MPVNINYWNYLNSITIFAIREEEFKSQACVFLAKSFNS